ncbi:hypothetical protein [Marinagarivorans cellulosilyticus]|uniref:hypothetical protein n=1 Tax=Marinagarivorans cellulosilyticus TaxID=2721545 RepID=UPI001F42045C|nr:hypothetical protein [Marinagarivorans cellulosilyticus]
MAKALAARLGFSVMHNHLTVDLAMVAYSGFGGGDFFEFVDELRVKCITKACENNVEGLVVTLCYDIEHDNAVIKNWVELVECYGGSVLPVYLDVSLTALENRVGNKSRMGTHKIQSKELLNECLGSNKFGPIPCPATISIDTSLMTVSESVEAIHASVSAFFGQT